MEHCKPIGTRSAARLLGLGMSRRGVTVALIRELHVSRGEAKAAVRAACVRRPRI